MNSISLGDMARAFQGQQLTTSLKTDLTRLGRELTTGVKADISSAVSGDFGPIADIERLLTTLAARKSATVEVGVLADTMQSALEAVQKNGTAMSTALLTLQGSQNEVTREMVAHDARERFDMVVTSLNTHTGGRTLFGGAATDRAALASASDMLSALVTATAAETTASGVASVVDAWFDTPSGGFETTGYLGSASAIGPFQLGDGEAIDLNARADDPAIRDALKSFALAALVAEGVLAGSPAEQSGLLALAGTRMIEADADLTILRADIGMTQARVETASVRNAAESTSLQIARNDLVAVDPYQAASQLEAAYTQLETFYTVTARLSRLTFTDFMR